LYTSSGDGSQNIDGYLRGLDVRDLFVETYGADLIGVPKTRPEFYAALAAHARVDPHDAVVVDDDARRLDWAGHLGMETVLVGTKDVGASHRRAATFADLVDVLS